MSEINDPAQTDSPEAPGDHGGVDDTSDTTSNAPHADAENAGNRAEPTAHADGATAPDGENAGNRAEPTAHADDAQAAAADGESESPDDSVGNRIDGPPTHLGTAAGTPAKKRRRRRKGEKTDGPPAEGEAERAKKPHVPFRGAADAAARRPFHVGDKVRGKVVKIGSAAVVVDLWGKEEGVLDIRELMVEGGEPPKLGDHADVVVVQDGSRGGNVMVTRDPQRIEVAREVVKHAFDTNEPIDGLVVGVNRGGLEVDLSGMRAFCPSSQIDARFPPSVNPKAMILNRYTFKVTSLQEDGREAVVSRRAIVEHEVRARAEELRSTLQIGSIVKGIVTAVKEYGVFVDLGGIEGMIHITELTHNRGARPSDVVKVGDEVEAKVLRITGGTRHDDAPAEPEHAAPDETAVPEASAAEAPAHAEADAPELSVEGSAEHTEADDASRADAPDAPARTAAPEADAKGAKGKREKSKPRGRPADALPRVVLSRRAVEPDPWDGIEKKYPVGSVHQGKVARMQPFGAFIELVPGVDGLLHVSELGEGKRVEHPNEVLKDGQSVNVRVERVEKGTHRIALSLLPEGVTEEQLQKSVVPRVGMIMQAKVIEHESFGGVWAMIDGAVGKMAKGFIAPQDSNHPRGTDLRKAIPNGSVVRVKVLEMDRGRPKLSIKAALQDEERAAYRQYQREVTSKPVGVSLADKLRAKLPGLAGGNKP